MEQSAVSRRVFLRLAAADDVAVVFGLDAGGNVFAALDASALARRFTPSQWIRIDQRGHVTIRATRSELGHDMQLAPPAIVVAELGADWSQVRVEHAEPGTRSNDFGSERGSASVSGRTLRDAAAAARAVLLRAAATRWRASPDDCETVNGFVVHRPTKRAVPFAPLVVDAARIPIPTNTPFRAL